VLQEDVADGGLVAVGDGVEDDGARERRCTGSMRLVYEPAGAKGRNWG
jgi:hypothetical protein